MVCNIPRTAGGTEGCMPRSRLVYSFPTITEGNQHSERIPRCINPGRDPDHNLDRNGADDDTDATAATDIRRRGGNSGIGRRRSNKVCIVGIRGQFEC
jgi:hypothetical protein